MNETSRRNFKPFIVIKPTSNTFFLPFKNSKTSLTTGCNYPVERTDSNIFENVSAALSVKLRTPRLLVNLVPLPDLI